MIFILSASARLSDQVAASHGLNRGQYRHVHDEHQLQGMEGQDLWVTPTAYRLRNFEMFVELAVACRMNVTEQDLKREQA